MTRHLRYTVGILGSLAAIAASGCERPSARPEGSAAGTGEPRGTALVVGSTVDEWGLLVLSREGGTARLRRLSDPTEVVWEGATTLPAFEEAHAAGGSSVTLRSGDGSVHRYDPARDAVESLGTVPGEAVTWIPGDEGGAWVAPTTGAILAVTPEGSWRVENGGPILWAAPVHGGIAILSSSGERVSLRYQPRAAEETAPGAEVQVGPPGVVTAWGRRAVLVETPGDRALRVLALDPVETAGQVELDGVVTSLAASPSSHQLYAGIADPARLEVVNRFSFRARTLARLRAPAREIRSSLFGESLLLFDGEGTWRIPVTGEEPRPVPGAWAPDLPIGMPDGSTLVRTAAGVERVAAGAGSGEPVSEDGSGWWVPVRWLPLPPAVAAEVEPTQVAGPPGRPAGAEAGGAPDAPASGDDRVEAGAVPAANGPPSGFYAIVGSARQRGGIESLVGELAGAGYPVEIQSVPDQAGETWYRGLVGPYATRAEAEAAARQLQRERRLQSWVTGVGFDG